MIKSKVDIKTLYDAYGRRIYNLVYYHIQSHEEAEEIVQDVFLAAHQQREKFRGEAQWGTYLYRIAINKSIDRLRSKKRKNNWLKWVPWSDGVSKAIPAEEETEDPHLHALLQAIQQLPEQQRTALVLMKIDQKSQKETAEIMGISPKAVESLVQRAKEKLKNFIQRFEGLE